jgi:hypothetical protein
VKRLGVQTENEEASREQERADAPDDEGELRCHVVAAFSCAH